MLGRLLDSPNPHGFESQTTGKYKVKTEEEEGFNIPSSLPPPLPAYLHLTFLSPKHTPLSVYFVNIQNSSQTGFTVPILQMGPLRDGDVPSRLREMLLGVPVASPAQSTSSWHTLKDGEF